MRRGNLALDMTEFFVGIFVLGIFFLFIYSPIHGAEKNMIDSGNLGVQGTAMLQQQDAAFPSTWDSAGLFIFALVWLFLIISSYYSRTSPVFFIITFILMIVVFVVLIRIGYVYQTLSVQQAQGAAAFPKLTWLNQHILEMGILVFFTCGLALYGKRDSGGGTL